MGLMSEIRYRVGNLIEAFNSGEVRAIAHQVNCFSTMRSGVAGAIAKEFPEVEHDDIDFRYGQPPANKLGEVRFIKTRRGMVLNLYGQLNYGREKGVCYTDYDALRKACVQADKIFSICSKPTRLGIPKIGSGLGGGDWDIVSKILKEKLTHCEIICYVLTEEDIPHKARNLYGQ